MPTSPSDYDPIWGRFKAKTLPTPGNHEYKTAGASGYFRNFGHSAAPHGVSYFAADVGTWHLFSLNSQIDHSGGSPQLRWLRSDLAIHCGICILAFWHQPRFSSGLPHGNDPSTEPFWRALFRARADVILDGHEHNYERSARQNPNGKAAFTGIREFVVSTGGMSHDPFGSIQPNSQRQIRGTFGVLQLKLLPHSYTSRYITTSGSFGDSGGPTICH